MIIEILLGIIFLILALIGIGLVKLRKQVKQNNLQNVAESSKGIEETFDELNKKLYKYTPQQLIEIFDHYQRILEMLDKRLENRYHKPLIQVSQYVELMKRKTQEGLREIYKNMNAPKAILNKYLQAIIGDISHPGEEYSPYQGVKGVRKVKYKPII